MIKQFFNTLFNEGESTTFAKFDRGTKVRPVEEYKNAASWAQWFCINPLDLKKDNVPTEEYHAPDKPRRADGNVTCFRNILLEFDGGNIERQKNFIIEFVPYTTLTYSGGKSMHAIISLATPAKDIKEYQLVVRCIYKAVNNLAKLVNYEELSVDEQCKNPSRLSRFPNARRDNGNIQTLVSLADRRTEGEILDFINANITSGQFEAIKDQIETSHEVRDSDLGPLVQQLSPFTKYYLMFGSTPGFRNSDLYKAACDMYRAGYEEDDIVNAALPIADLSISELTRTVRSARFRQGE